MHKQSRSLSATMTGFLCVVVLVVAVCSATPTADSIPALDYRLSSTPAPHEQQLQKTDYIASESYSTQATPRKAENGEGFFSVWRTAGRLLLECSKSGDLVGCLKVKAVTSLGRALTTPEPVVLPLPFLDGVSLTRDPSAEVPLTGQELEQSDDQVVASLPRALDERAVRLDRLLMERLDAFLKTRTLQFSVPLTMGLVEGRGKGIGGKKGKGNGMMIMMIAGLKAMMMQSAMGGIAMMSGKALLVAKIALLLALLCCLKKGGGEDKSQIVYAAAPEHSSGGGGGGGGWQSGGGAESDWGKRSVTADPYSAYNPHNYGY